MCVRTTALETLTVGPVPRSLSVLCCGLKPAQTTKMSILSKGDLKIGFAQGKFGKWSQLDHLDKHVCDTSHHSVDFISCRCHHKCCDSPQNFCPSNTETIPRLSGKSSLLIWVQSFGMLLLAVSKPEPKKGRPASLSSTQQLKKK